MTLQFAQEYIKEFVLLCHRQWGKPWKEEEYEIKLEIKISNTIKRLDRFPTLILLDGKTLVGFVSIFEKDCDERNDLTPWIATVFIKEEYRGKGYSRILMDNVITEAKKLNYNEIYLKTKLTDYYEKYGFSYIETLNNGEKLYYKKLLN